MPTLCDRFFTRDLCPKDPVRMVPSVRFSGDVPSSSNSPMMENPELIDADKDDCNIEDDRRRITPDRVSECRASSLIRKSSNSS